MFRVLEATAFVTEPRRHEDEGNAYLRLGEALQKIGREDGARATFTEGIHQAEKFGHSGMAEDLRSALIGLGER